MSTSRVDIAIIGGGISGLAALHFVRTRRPDFSVKLFEAEDRLGGTIGSDRVGGFSFDWGPNGFLDREPLTLQLCDELGLSREIERANENVSNRFILRGGRLRFVPMTPRAFLTSDILSWCGKLRILAEPFASKAADDTDESIYDFGKRRIGSEAADYLIQPMVSGIFGGLAHRLSLRACFPAMHDMERQHGSLFRAMLAKARKARREGRKSGGPSGPGGRLTSFHGGLDVLINRFKERYQPFINTGVGISSVRRAETVYNVATGTGDTVEAHSVVLAIPSADAARVVSSLSQELSEALAGIPYAPIAVVCLGYPLSAVRHSLKGFGFLIPPSEGRRILGSIWTSSIFADRAPQGYVQFRTMVGGDGDHDSIRLADDELVRLVTNDLGQILGINGAPEVVKVYRWTQGIPQYHIGHLSRLGRIEHELAKCPGLYLAGNAYYGVGLNDCVKQSHETVLALSRNFPASGGTGIAM